MTQAYRVIDHTGDLGVEVEADDLAELIRRASLALSDTLVEVERVQGKLERQWTVESETEEGLMVAQLQEILFQMDAEGMVFGEFKISQPSRNKIHCRASGEKLDREGHGFKTEIKAVTYHGLKIVEKEGRKTARIIFDV